MEKQINELARIMVIEVANKHIKVQNKWEGMDAQREAFVIAEEMLRPVLKRLFKRYGEVIKHSQPKEL